MEKPKINGISSSNYEKGRIDVFTLSSEEDIHRQLMSVLVDLGIQSDNVEEFDIVTSDKSIIGSHFFIYGNGIRVHLFISEDELELVVDSNIPKEELMTKVEKYFQTF